MIKLLVTRMPRVARDKKNRRNQKLISKIRNHPNKQNNKSKLRIKLQIMMIWQLRRILLRVSKRNKRSKRSK